MTSSSSMAEELQFLIDNPDFWQRPATIAEFLGPLYLNVEDTIRPGIKRSLIKIFGTKVTSYSFSQVRRALVTGAIGIGKGHCPSTPLLTPTGWRKLGEIKEGDSVIGSDGKATRVTGVFPRGELPSYLVSFNDGASVVVDGDHLWTVQSPSQRARSGAWSTETTKFLMEDGVTNARGQRRWHIPVVDEVEFSKGEDLLVDAYAMGVLIGDGSFVDASPRLSSADQEIVDWVGEALDQELVHVGGHDYRIVARRGAGGYIGHRLNPLTEALRAYGLHGSRSYDKFIPEAYLTAPIEDRWNLLRGLMDSDGYILRHGSSQISTSSERLALDIQALVRSLGGIARLTRKATVGRDAHILTLNVKRNPFRIPRKADKWSVNEKYTPARMIDSITPVEPREIICISVEADDSLYVTKDYIVTHNTTFASIAIPYMVHWVTCLNDPQKHFNFMPGSRIAFMLMSTRESQAKEVLFGDIKARIAPSPWFQSNCQFDTEYRNQLRFPKDIWVLPGNSAETTFEGYNILGGILDEGDSHKVTADKDFAESGYDTIHSRIDSRFNDPEKGDHRGLLIVVGQMKKSIGFMAKTKERYLEDERAAIIEMAIWESLGWDKFTDKATGERKSFYYDTRRKLIIPKRAAEDMGMTEGLIEVPDSYKKNFLTDPEKALRDLAGIPPAINDPFISLVDRVDESMERWDEEYGDDYGDLRQPISESPSSPKLSDELYCHDSLERTIHIDIATSGDGDALGMAMGHVRELVEVDGELRPHIVIDMFYRMRALSGREIILSDIRQVIYNLRDERGFHLSSVTMDGFQSTDTRQQLRRQGIRSTYLSVDRKLAPYYDLREAIYEQRIDFPKYSTLSRTGDAKTVNIIKRELEGLSEKGGKVDHPATGSKDVADALAGVVHTLMTAKRYRRSSPGTGSAYAGSNGSVNKLPDWITGTGVPVGGGASAPRPPALTDLKPFGY